MQHRHAIADWIVRNNREYSLNTVIDYGGGFGTLARLIAKKKPRIQITIYEPQPSDFAINQAARWANISFLSTIDREYDCLVSTDVLEHVPDPLKTLSEMIDAVRQDGYLIIANNFYPVIKCHLPRTFHLRYTFDGFASIMGCEKIGPCEDSHGTIYRKIVSYRYSWKKIRLLENLSKLAFPFLRVAHSGYHRLKKLAG